MFEVLPSLRVPYYVSQGVISQFHNEYSIYVRIEVSTYMSLFLFNKNFKKDNRFQ